MAIGDRTPKKLAQSALTTTAATYYTGVTSYRTQLTQIFLANTNTTTTRYVTLYAYGTAAANTIAMKIELAANGSTIIDSKIVLLASETFSAKQDTGTDVTITLFGVEEQIA